MQNQIQGGLLSPGCVVALPLSFDNAGHTTEESKTKDWRLGETASRAESWESPKGAELAFFSLPHLHHPQSKEGNKYPKSEMPAAYDDIDEQMK